MKFGSVWKSQILALNPTQFKISQASNFEEKNHLN